MASFSRRKDSRILTSLLLLVTFLAQAITIVFGQHSAQAPNPHVESSLAQAFQPRRDDSHVENVVKQAVADEFKSEINTNRTKAYLSCESGEMLVKINFSEPFRGVGYADYDRSSPCRFYGDGSRYYELHIPLKGCGTKQEAPRLFINNIIVRFHRSLELEEDEIKTIICRYPPPFAPLPNNVVAPILAPLPVVPALVPAKLSEIELLLIICALLFLTLLLLGIGIAYYCLKKRNIKVVKKKKAFSSAPGSEITKLSGSTLGAPALSIFEPIRIPRAQAALSTSGSEAALLTPSRSVSQQETIPSDYPSESPSSVSSDVEEMVVDSRRALVVNDVATMRQDRYRFENLAFIPDEASIRSGYPIDQERAESVSSVPIFTVPKPPTKIEMPKPRLAKEQTLTTIHEREDSLMSDKWATSHAHTTIIDHDLLPPVHIQRTKAKHKKAPPPPSVSSYAPSLYGSIPDNNSRAVSDVIEITAETTKALPPPPSVSSYAPSLYGSIPDNDICSQSEVMDIVSVVPKPHAPKVQMATLTDYYVDTQNTTDIREDITTHRRHEEYPPPVPREIPEEITEVTETTIVPHKPKITVKNIDDVYVTTLTEIDASEHITRRTRDTIEEHARIPSPPPLPPTPPPTTFDVRIRTYPKPSPPPSSSGTLVPDEPHRTEKLISTTNLTSTTDIENTTIDQRYRRNWEDTFSEVSERFSEISEPVPPNLEIPQPRTPSPPPLPSSPPPPAVSPTPLPERSQTPDTEVHSGIHPIEPEPYTGTVPRLPVLEETPTLPTTWSVLVRVLKPPPNTPNVEELTPQVREKWRSVITTDSVFRSLIQECTTTEEYVRVTRSERYYHLFRPTTWQVIIRVLAAPLEPSERDPVGYGGPSGPGRNLPPRYRRKSDTSEPSRPRRNSLPPVYEGDSSNPPSVEAQPSYPYYTPGSPRSRRTSKAGSVWDYDVRSMTEEDVDFTRADRESLWSVDTGYTYKTGRSFAERSTSEFLEDVPTRRFSQNPPSEPRTPMSTSAPNPSYRVPMHSDPEDDDNDEPLELPIYPVTTISNRSDNMYSTDSRAYTQVSQNVQSSYSVQSSSQIRQEQQHQHQQHRQQTHRGGPRSIGPPPSSVGEREEIYSVTETDIYDWNR